MPLWNVPHSGCAASVCERNGAARQAGETGRRGPHGVSMDARAGNASTTMVNVEEPAIRRPSNNARRASRPHGPAQPRDVVSRLNGSEFG